MRIIALLRRVNDAWSTGLPEALPAAVRDCFHDDVVFRAPNLSVVARGRDAAIASFQGFMRAAQIEYCNIGEPEIDLAGDAAIASFPWAMEYRLGSDPPQHESGYEIDVLERGRDRRWRVCWRTVIVTPKTANS
jgi:ketosteroid isomerase-like protein